MKSFVDFFHGINLASETDLSGIFQNITTQATESMGAKGCSIQLFDRYKKNLITCAYYGISPQYGEKEAIGTDDAINALIKGETIKISHVRTDPRIKRRENAIREGIEAVLSVPLQLAGETIGSIRIYLGEPHQFTEQEEELLRSFAVESAVAVRNLQRFNRIHLLNVLSKQVISHWDTEEVFDFISEYMTVVLGVQGCALLTPLPGNPALKIESHHGISQELAENFTLSPEGLPRLMDQTLQWEDLEKEPNIPHKEILMEEGIKSLLLTPLKCRDEIKGLLLVANAYPHRFHREDMEFIEIVAAFAVISLHTGDCGPEEKG